MRKRRPRGEHKKTCSWQGGGACTNPITNNRYCKEHHAEYMRIWRTEQKNKKNENETMPCDPVN